MLSYVWRDLVRNPRRTLASLVGIVLGVGLFSGRAVLHRRLRRDDDQASDRAARRSTCSGCSRRRWAAGSGSRSDCRHRAGSRAGRERRPSRSRSRTTAPSPANEVVRQRRAAAAALVRARHDDAERRPRPGRRRGRARSPRVWPAPGSTSGPLPGEPRTRSPTSARANRSVADVAALRPPGHDLQPRGRRPATGQRRRRRSTLDQLRARIARIPGVAAADALSFVDLPPGVAASREARPCAEPVRVFGFDRRYQAALPLDPSRRPARSSTVAAAERRGRPGAGGRARRHGRADRAGPTRRRCRCPSAASPISRGPQPLFSSRKSTKLEDFLYVPNSVVVSPATFENAIIPAFQAASAARGPVLKSLPGAGGRRAGRPITAADRTRPRRSRRPRPSLGRSTESHRARTTSSTTSPTRCRSPSDDAAVGKRMFVFLGLPGRAAGRVPRRLRRAASSPATQRREQANLRIRGADRGHLRRMLAYRTLAFAVRRLDPRRGTRASSPCS